MDLGLRGKTAFITGGSKGVGKHTAAIMAEEGANVAIFARGQAELDEATEWIQKRTGRKVLAISGDVTSDLDVEAGIKATVEAYGGLDIVVNNAGSAAGRPFSSISIADWQGDLDLKLYGAIRVIQAALPHL